MSQILSFKPRRKTPILRTHSIPYAFVFNNIMHFEYVKMIIYSLIILSSICSDIKNIADVILGNSKISSSLYKV